MKINKDKMRLLVFGLSLAGLSAFVLLVARPPLDKLAIIAYSLRLSLPAAVLASVGYGLYLRKRGRNVSEQRGVFAVIFVVGIIAGLALILEYNAGRDAGFDRASIHSR